MINCKIIQSFLHYHRFKCVIFSFGQLNPNASKLIITPKVSFKDDSEITFEDEDDDIFFNGDDLKGKEIVFDDIVVDLEK